jgi:hypothetical protein
MMLDLWDSLYIESVRYKVKYDPQFSTGKSPVVTINIRRGTKLFNRSVGLSCSWLQHHVTRISEWNE